ncbi:MAG: fused MFS/spermidine synthase [Acidobacteriia bacterium]|nr:fused MFS/spermidine synthase [Terriglobia bacterium]
MALYALTTLVSAFLLFQVQPVIAKTILPWFGGSAAVWTTCLLFFQVVLLLGYLYAHALIRYLSPRLQVLVHAVLLLASAWALPVHPATRWKPAGPEDPTYVILMLLATTVGLPYFLLSSTGPLLQAWYARRYQGAMPYRLYALSNAGSMFSLLSYPVLFEPAFTTHQQAGIWSLAYGAFIVLCGFTAVRTGTRSAVSMRADREASGKPGLRLYATWMALPACASVLLLATTNHLSQNVAAIPFLWVLPLSIYLLTFILCFEGSGGYRRKPYLRMLAVSLWVMGIAVGIDMHGNVPIKIMVPLFAAGLYVCSMACHGELVRLKPHPRYLTHFYLTISAGGAAGGLLVGLVAPHIFNAYYEMPLGLVACGALVLMVLQHDGEPMWYPSWRHPAPLVAWTLLLGLAAFLGLQMRDSARVARVAVRNFYGELRVQDSGPASVPYSTRTLIHGTIDHGEQYLDPARRGYPTTYYGPHTGVGIAIHERQARGAIRVGVIGLGTGTLAAYGRPGDYYRFYEINPLVLRIAQSEFFFLRDSRANVDVVLGDARLSLEREAPQDFDVLAVDAFSSDSIPLHLLTREAMSVFFRHLKPDGVLAVHITNRCLDLGPVLAGESHSAGKLARVVDTRADDTERIFAAKWVLMTAPPSGFDRQVMGNSLPLGSKRIVRLWTDDYSNLLQVLK